MSKELAGAVERAVRAIDFHVTCPPRAGAVDADVRTGSYQTVGLASTVPGRVPPAVISS